MQMSVVGVIFADSMRTGDREMVYTIYRVISNLGSLVGPVIQIVFFYFNGDDWSSENLRMVMVIGIALSASALPIQLFIDENKTLGNKSEAKQRQIKIKTVVDDDDDDNNNDDDVTTTTKGTNDDEEDEEIPPPPPQQHDDDRTDEDEEESPPPSQQRDETDEFYARVLRWSIVMYDLFRVLFGGLVDKYFGIFFKEPLGISPIGSSLIQLGCRLGIIITTSCVGWISKKHVPAALVCLMLLIFVNAANVTLSVDTNESNMGYGKWILVAAYIVRGSALVSVFGLKHALLMDRVPKKHRGKYSAIDDLQSGFWSGSAALGGWLIHAYSYRMAFSVMSAGFGLATFSWFGVVYSDCMSRQHENIMNEKNDSTDDDDEEEEEEQQQRLDESSSKCQSEERDGDDTDDYDTYDDISHRFQNIMTNDTMFDDGFIPSRSSLPRRRGSGSRKRRRRRRRTGSAHSRLRSPSLPAMRGGKFGFLDDVDFGLDRTWPPRPSYEDSGDSLPVSSMLSRYDTH